MIKQTDPKKRGKAARNKGKRGELQLAHLINDMWGYKVRRGKTYYHESDVVGLKGIHIECKCVDKLNIWSAMQQAIEEAKIRNDGLPAVFHKRDRTGWLVTMRIEDWFDMYGSWNDGR